MKKIILSLAFLSLCLTAYSQNPSYQDKLYYTCKIWGFVKFYHSEVSTCKLNWDSILIAKLPAVKAAANEEEFNNVLIALINSAGPTAKAAYFLPDTLPSKLKINRNFSWFDDKMIRADVKALLDTIRINFNPHPNCNVIENDGTGSGWLAFPADKPIFKNNELTKLPNEFAVLRGVFAYWNIINYCNPYNDILETPWDSTLRNNIVQVSEAKDQNDFILKFRRFTARLDDAHVEGLTSGSFGSFIPKIMLKTFNDKYVVVKSGYKEIAVGDIITGVNGMTIGQWEDSLKKIVSAGNPSVFRRSTRSLILQGDIGTEVKMDYTDANGTAKTFSALRYSSGGSWFNFSPSPELDTVKWKLWDCNVAYVNMAILQPSDVASMYQNIYDASTIIFDVRNYPNGTIYGIIDKLLKKSTTVVSFTMPDANYPGTYYIDHSVMGKANLNPYEGKVIILCNEETQSHAEFTCMILKAYPSTVIVGSQTAGADGNITQIKLSSSINTGFTSLGTFYPDWTQTQRIGIVPDSVVIPTPEAIRQGRDEVLEKALEIARCPVSVQRKEASELSFQVMPNPAKESAVIKINIEGDAFVSINIYDMLGNKLNTIKEGFLNGGAHSFDFDGRELSAGVYYYQISVNGINQTKKLIIIK